MRCPKNGLPILFLSKAPVKQIKKPNKAGKNQTSDFCYNRQNRTTNTEKLNNRFLFSHNNNLINHSRFFPSQATQARSQPRMATNGDSNKRIHREQAVTEE
ncbi:hypothetical protein M9H77_30586 [Catharanthus roseus]|uniref:Uncharacterized protein n=1 Tax=Catharanthus roseus TaxID=4058 RepID=A0ACB9ZZQ0_CATRO|nr:hypothetical protein M9H77_30586 [Catharanthus roseus]